MHCTSSCHTPWTRCCYPHLTDEETKHKRFDNLQKDHKCHSWGSNLDLPGSFGHSMIRREEWCVSFQEALVEACIPFYLLLSFKSWLPVQELRVLPAFDILVPMEGSKAKEYYGILWGGWNKTWDANLGVSPRGPLDAVTPPNSPMTRPLSQSLLSPTPLSVTPWEEGKQTILMYRGSLGAEFPAGKIARKSHGHSDQQESEAQEDRTPEDRRIFSVNLEAFKRFNKLQPWSRRMHWESFLVHSSLYLLALQRAGFHKESLEESQWGLLWQPSG